MLTCNICLNTTRAAFARKITGLLDTALQRTLEAPQGQTGVAPSGTMARPKVALVTMPKLP
jgi:hypothetical protein